MLQFIRKMLAQRARRDANRGGNALMAPAGEAKNRYRVALLDRGVEEGLHIMGNTVLRITFYVKNATGAGGNPQYPAAGKKSRPEKISA